MHKKIDSKNPGLSEFSIVRSFGDVSPQMEIDQTHFQLSRTKPEDDFSAILMNEARDEAPTSRKTLNTTVPFLPRELHRLNLDSDKNQTPSPRFCYDGNETMKTLDFASPVPKRTFLFSKKKVSPAPSIVNSQSKAKKEEVGCLQKIFGSNSKLKNDKRKGTVFPEAMSLAGNAAKISSRKLKSLRARQNWKKAKFLLHMARMVGNLHIALNERDDKLSRGKSAAELGLVYSNSFWSKLRRWHINPDNRLYLIWQAVFQLLTVYYIFVSPYILAFRINSNQLAWVNRSIDILYAFDIFIHFFVALKNRTNGDIIWDKKLILKDYLAGTLIIDILAVTPFEIFLRSLEGLKLIRIVRLSLVLNIFNVCSEKVVSYFVEGSKSLKISSFVSSFLSLWFIMVVIFHFATCIWISLGYETQPGELTWFDRINDSSINPSAQFFQTDYFTLYMIGLFQVTVTLTTVGYGTFEGNTLREYFFSMGLELFGIMFFAFLMYKLRSTVKSLNEFEMKYIEENEAIETWLFGIDRRVYEHRGVTNPDILNNIKDTIKSMKLHDRAHLLDTSDIFKSLNPKTKSTIIKLSFESLIVKFNTLFRGLSEQFVLDLLASTESKLFINRQSILRRGVHSPGMYLVLEGNILVYGSSTEIAIRKFGPNSFFGEVSIAQDECSAFTFMAEDQVKCLLIRKEVFREIGRKHPKDMLEILSLIYFRHKILLHLKQKLEDNSGSYQDLDACINELIAQDCFDEPLEAEDTDQEVLKANEFNHTKRSRRSQRTLKYFEELDKEKPCIFPPIGGRNYNETPADQFLIQKSEDTNLIKEGRNHDERPNERVFIPDLEAKRDKGLFATHHKDKKAVTLVPMGNLSGELDESSTDSESEVNDSELEYSDGCPVENTEFDFEAIISEDLFPEYLEGRIDFYQRKLEEVKRKIRMALDSFSRMVTHEQARTCKRMGMKKI